MVPSASSIQSQASVRRTPSTSSTTDGARVCGGAVSGVHAPAGSSTSSTSWAVLSPVGPLSASIGVP
jgi:hypothetical protein